MKENVVKVEASRRFGNSWAFKVHATFSQSTDTYGRGVSFDRSLPVSGWGALQQRMSAI